MLKTRGLNHFPAFTPKPSPANAIAKGSQLMKNQLDGKTPAEACGIEIRGQDKWKIIIERASL